MFFRVFASVSLAACLFTGCAIKNEVNDGLWEIRAKVSEASLTIEQTGDAEVGTIDFNFVYLLGIVDAEGVTGVQWRYALLDPRLDESARSLGSTYQEMRPAQENSTEIFVQGERPRQLTVEGVSWDRDQTYVLAIEVEYRETVLGEVLIPIRVDQTYLNLEPLEDIPQLSTR